MAVTALGYGASEHRRAMWMRGDAVLQEASTERIEAVAISRKGPAQDRALLILAAILAAGTTSRIVSLTQERHMHRMQLRSDGA
ncbi:hypothetical protein OHS59_44230 [Streptomyces sp. NBC_00414]|uniref:hypothetical protein n=1 Tax=Streptomyces sp. NBC_00414 TaxID=2975739 RepID=UPI002E24D464